MRQFVEPADLAVRIRGVEVVESFRSARQDLQLLRHPILGLIFTINDELQHAEAWQAFYHEPLIHVPASFVPRLTTALVLGGGSLFAAAELLRYPTLEHCILVDHDPAVLELMGRHYPHARQVLADPRFSYVDGDAMTYVTDVAKTFDLVINDCLDLLATSLPNSFGLLKDRLNPAGACGDVIYRHVLEKEHVAGTQAGLAGLGPIALSLVTIPEYPGVMHMLTIWGGSHIDQEARVPSNDVQLGWCREGRRPPLESDDPRFLSFHLYVPPFLRRIWKSDARSADEGVPKTQLF